MAPEYAMHGEFSLKSDVYSFGVLVLEIISGRKNSANIFQGDDMEYLLSYVSYNFHTIISSLSFKYRLEDNMI